MWLGSNLQRAHKYTFASKMPLLRFDQSDLKCKNGCDYFGNPQWQGYCSKCHREQMQKQRRAEKSSSAYTLPNKEKRVKLLNLSSHSSFSKFEEKRLRQSETLKKANLLKFSSVFKKNDEERETPDKKPSEFKIPPIVFERMKRQFHMRFPNLSPQIDKDARAFVHSFIMDVIKNAHTMNVDELSERVQRQYQRYIKHMDTSQNYSNLEPETKELLVDFVEKHAMIFLHGLGSVVFSPPGTEDERLDRAMSERIQQLGWVCETHLDCKVNRDQSNCRQLLYKAIGELLGMDSARSPGGKVRRAVRCCEHVVALAAAAHGGAVSADHLLPALILTVLKANPPRLISNINFVTRFCNAARLMTGEGGYYFTNLCCAVSFIENITAESLNMEKEEFDCYMTMPASIGGSSWAAALSLCAEVRESEEQTQMITALKEEFEQLECRAMDIATCAQTFEKEIAKKVEDVLRATPLEIKPRRSWNTNRKSAEEANSVLVDLTTQKEDIAYFNVPDKKETEDVLDFVVVEKPKTPEQNWDLKQSNSLELLTPSPIGYTPFDSRSIDELITPDDLSNEHLPPGLHNINYDLDLSDLSAENSVADDIKSETKSIDDILKCDDQSLNPLLGEFAQLNIANNMALQNNPNPFDMKPTMSCSAFSPFVSMPSTQASILDINDSPTAEYLLPSPLTPQSSDKPLT